MYQQLKEDFRQQFQHSPGYLFSAPGRTELGGNHTDHQLGLVLAAAVDLDTAAAVGLNGQDCVRVLSQGYPLCQIRLDELEPRADEQGSSAALIRGVLAGVRAAGGALPGFDACVRSRVLPGSGLSSSAAFEVLMGTIASHLSGAALAPLEIARIGQQAENRYFGKPCGLMDQAASAIGGVIAIDFADPKAPAVEHLDLDFSTAGYALCIIDSGADHTDLTADYAAIPEELAAVCRFFGCSVLRQLPEADLYGHMPELRRAAGDRAVLRAIHIYEDNRRVAEQVLALKSGDMDRFLTLVTASGRSSWMYLQNVIPVGATRRQALAVALAVTERLLAGRGAFRVQGGGFAGTLEAFVPLDVLPDFRQGIEELLGKDRCQVLSIRREGGTLLEEL